MLRSAQRLDSLIKSPSTRIGAVLYGIAAVGLGILGLKFGDFALQWQPVPTWVPARMAIAEIVAMIFVVAGVMILAKRKIALASALLAAMTGANVLLLHLPRVIMHPLDVSIWLGLAEAQALFAGAALLGVVDQPQSFRSRFAVFCFAIALPIFGLSHLVYAQFTAAMVPKWIAFPLFWAIFTGLAHAAGGFAILSSIFARAGAMGVAIMYSSWVLVLHAPRVWANPADRVEWTMIVIALCLSGTAWLVANVVGQRHKVEGNS